MAHSSTVVYIEVGYFGTSPCISREKYFIQVTTLSFFNYKRTIVTVKLEYTDEKYSCLILRWSNQSSRIPFLRISTHRAVDETEP